ncbi:DUF2264 domain-containing protein [Tropicimonas sediminicola]|nr:DUF2264 domain-containing protein [Tropicimonas sediminicola]
MPDRPAMSDRDDLAAWAGALIRPVAALVPEGGARLRLGVWGADYDAVPAEMEAFVRPLWGLAPLVAGGFDAPEAGTFLRGIAAGTDPAHPDYWGEVGPSDQRMVEMAGIAMAWLLAPQAFWEPLGLEAQTRAAAWMRQINDQPPSDNNWLYFRVLVNLALARLGEDWSRPAVEAALDRLDTFYLGEGWYRDGEKRQIDYYVPMAFHFYGLVLAQLGGDQFPERARVLRSRARAFAESFQVFFASDGAAIPFGRSMTYRMAQSAFWAACAFAGEEVLPWPRIKGLLMRNLRWWAGQPITDRDGVLSIGYAYPNPLMSEGYNGIGAPNWALKAFLVLALGRDHPFWRAEEEPPEDLPEVQTAVPAAGFLLRRARGHAILLTGGQDARAFRGCDAKYGGFAYSSAFGFSVPSDATAPERPEMSAMDSGLAVSRDGLAWLRRGRVTDARLRDGMAWGRWAPDGRLEVETWCDFAGEGWHLRLHRIRSADPLEIAESGFAIDRTSMVEPADPDESGVVFLRNASLVSGLRDMNGVREAEVIRAAPNTNILHPRTAIPRLVGRLPAGESLLVTGALGCPVGAWSGAEPQISEAFLQLCARMGADPRRVASAS